MAKKQKDRAAALIKDVETAAKRLRTEIRRRAQRTGLVKTLQSAADQLRKRAAAAAAQVEKYVHELRKELEKGSKPPKRKKKVAKKKPAPMPTMPV